MNRSILSALIMGMLLLLLLSPFAALSLLMLMLFGAMVWGMLMALLQGMTSSSEK